MASGCETVLQQARAAATARMTGALETYMAMDRLTGLPGGLAFSARADQEVKRASRQGIQVTVIAVAVERPATDDGILLAAEALIAGTRDLDLVARTDEDRFALLLPDCGELGARVVLRRLVTIAGAVGITLAAASASTPATDGCDLLADADSALTRLLVGRRSELAIAV